MKNQAEMLDKYEQYLSSRKIVLDKKITYYAHWVRQCYQSCNKSLEQTVQSNEIERYLNRIEKYKEPWQIVQAREAISLFLFFKDHTLRKKSLNNPIVDGQWSEAMNQMVKIIRLKQLSPRTEKTYLSWIRSFKRFIGSQSPYDLNSEHVKNYLTFLAAEKRVAASTQNLAFNALLFLYRYILECDIGDIKNVVRARRKRRIPVVLTRSEIDMVLYQLSGTNQLMAKIIYGAGLRLKECLKLRIKDIDFDRGRVTVL